MSVLACANSRVKAAHVYVCMRVGAPVFAGAGPRTRARCARVCVRARIHHICQMSSTEVSYQPSGANQMHRF